MPQSLLIKGKALMNELMISIKYLLRQADEVYSTNQQSTL